MARSQGASSTAGDATAATPRASRSGADIYAQFMDNYHRRMRKAQPSYGNDAAGVTTMQRFLTRNTPLKGKGAPPPDNHYPEYKPSKKFITGRSHAAVPELLVHHTKPLAMSMDSGLMMAALRAAEGAAGSRPTSAYVERPCLKMTDLSSAFRGSMQGSGLSIISEEKIHRPVRKPGTAAPTSNTKARVMVLACDDDSINRAQPGTYITSLACNSPVNNAKEAMLNSTWARQSYEAGLLSSSPSVRPSTAPPATQCADPRSEARNRYHANNNANLDVFQYRHSGGICSEVYKLDDSRAPAPQLASPRPDSARSAYYEARVGYSTNRVRGLISLPKYG